jgi:hypothetical protein
MTPEKARPPPRLLATAQETAKAIRSARPLATSSTGGATKTAVRKLAEFWSTSTLRVAPIRVLNTRAMATATVKPQTKTGITYRKSSRS